MRVQFKIYQQPELVGWIGWFDVFKINFQGQNEPDERYFLGLNYELHYENELSTGEEYDPQDWWKE